MNRRELMGIADEKRVRQRIDDEVKKAKSNGTYGKPGSPTAKTIKQSAMKPVAKPEVEGE